MKKFLAVIYLACITRLTKRLVVFEFSAKRFGGQILAQQIFKTTFLGAGLILAGAGEAKAAVLLAGWNFNTQANGAASTPIAADHGSGSLSLSGLNSISDATISGSGGTSVNSGGDAALKALFIAGGTSENGKSIIFTLSMSGYQGLVLTYATEKTGTAFTAQDWSYSINGGAYTSSGISGSSVTVPAAYATETVDFSSISALNNASSVSFQLILSGATGNIGSDHFDNFQFNADVVPEPAEWGLISAIGLLGICGVRTLREQRAAKHATLA